MCEDLDTSLGPQGSSATLTAPQEQGKRKRGVCVCVSECGGCRARSPTLPLSPSLLRQLCDNSSSDDDGWLPTVAGHEHSEHAVRTLNRTLLQRRPRSPRQAAREGVEAQRRSLQTEFFVEERGHAVDDLTALLRENTGCSRAEERQCVEEFKRRTKDLAWDLAEYKADLILNPQTNVGCVAGGHRVHTGLLVLSATRCPDPGRSRAPPCRRRRQQLAPPRAHPSTRQRPSRARWAGVLSLEHAAGANKWVADKSARPWQLSWSEFFLGSTRQRRVRADATHELN